MATPKKASNRPKSRSAGSSSGKKKPAARKKPSASSKSTGGKTRKAPAKRSTSASTSKAPAKRAASASTRKSPAKRASSSATRKPPAKRAASSATRKAPAKAASKTAPKSGAGAEAKADWAPTTEAPVRTAVDAKAAATTPSLRPGGSRRGSIGRWLAIGALLAAVVVVIIVIASGGDDNNTTIADTTPAKTPTATSPAVTSPSAGTPAAPAGQPAVRTEKCDPIIGSGTVNGGKTYEVTSSAKDGDPADCGEAHSVLLSTLQGQGTTIGDWSCKTNPSGTTVASCTSTGGRSIQATG
jgi:hypothetical protein